MLTFVNFIVYFIFIIMFSITSSSRIQYREERGTERGDGREMHFKFFLCKSTGTSFYKCSILFYSLSI
jgi:hypothetical protein